MKTKPEKLKIVITRLTCIKGVDVKPGDVVNAPFDDAKLLVSIDKAKLYQDEEPKEKVIPPKIYTIDELSDLGIAELRVIGKPYGVTDNKKDDLVLKIIDAQGE